MVQQQLVDYIKNQLGVGVGKEELKNALVEAGWKEADIDDSIKSAMAAGGTGVSAFTPQSKSAATGKPIIMSDLIPNTSEMEVIAAATTSASENSKSSESKSRLNLKTPKVDAKTAVIIAVGILAVCAAGAAIYFYMQAKGASDRLAISAGVSGAAEAQVTSLNSQITELTNAKNNLTAQVSSLTAENQKLGEYFSLFVTPPGSSATSGLAVDFSGVLSGGGKSAYALTASSGVIIFVKNYKDEKVGAALEPLAGQTVRISGTHMPASQNVTVTSVNGASVQ